MQIIPVLDLSKGIVAHAVQGKRKLYRPIISKLCPSSNPLDIINCFLKLYPFKKIYIADLDALEQSNDNTNTIKSICKEFPNLEIWLDTGTSLINHYLEDSSFDKLRLILSTESLNSTQTLESFINHYSQHNFIMSIDFKSNEILGSKELLLKRQHWPLDLIILNLDNVGTNEGVSLPKQLNNLDLFRTHNTFYGGGIRDNKDLYKLDKLGITGVLISTSLHKKTINKDDLLSFSQ